MDITIRHSGLVSIIELPGRFVRGEPTDAVERSIASLVDSGRVRIVLDMGRMTFIDSSGLGELMACHRRVAGMGGGVRLLKPPARILELLDITQLKPLFESFEDEAAALGSF
jgi:anti-sigma B factor antagonist